MQTESASMPVPSNAARNVSWKNLLQSGAYLLVIALSYAAVVTVMPMSTRSGDQDAYLVEARKINTGGLSTYIPDTSAYGYPLFLAAMLQLADATGMNASDLIMLVQFAFHTGIAFLGLAILDKLSPGAPFGMRLLCFVLIQANPVLLGLTRLFLTDSLTVFPVTVMLWGVVYQPKGKYLLFGTALGAAMILRPFHQVWFMAWIVGGLVVAVFRGRRMHRPLSWTIRQGLPANFRQGALMAAHCLIPLAGILTPQMLTVYQAENRIGLSGSEAGIWAQRHLALGLFLYKYETFSADGVHAYPIRYLNKRGLLNIQERMAQPRDSIVVVLLTDIPGMIITLPVVKLAGIFQNYDWSVYRTDINNQFTLVTAWGGVIFFLFLYMLQSFLFRLRVRIKAADGLLNIPLMLFLGVSAYVWLYVLFTAPEGRFVAPAIPALVALAFHRILLEKSPRRLVLTAIAACVLYLLTFIILAESVTLVTDI